MAFNPSQEWHNDRFSANIVIDNGSSMTKAAFHYDQEWTSVFPTMIGSRIYKGEESMFTRDQYVGDQAQKLRGVLSLRYPVERGIITNWDDMELIWHDVFYNWIRAPPEEHYFVFTEPPLNPKRNREKLAEYFLEKYQSPGLYIGSPAVLSLYASGRTTGICCESGDGVTQIVPVHEGIAMSDAVQRLNLGGRDLTYFLAQMLIKRGLEFTSSGALDLVREIKENVCHTAFDLEEELALAEKSSAAKTEYELPDGSTIRIGEEKFVCPEALFQPSLIGMDYVGIHESTYNSIIMCEKDIQKVLLANIVVTGGNFRCAGMVDRMTKEIKSLAPSDIDVNVVTPPDLHKSAWMGASMLTALSTFSDMRISKEEYDEYGPGILHTKFF